MLSSTYILSTEVYHETSNNTSKLQLPSVCLQPWLFQWTLNYKSDSIFNISTWMPNKQLKLKMSKTELQIFFLQTCSIESLSHFSYWQSLPFGHTNKIYWSHLWYLSFSYTIQSIRKSFCFYNSPPSFSIALPVVQATVISRLYYYMCVSILAPYTSSNTAK